MINNKYDAQLGDKIHQLLMTEQLENDVDFSVYASPTQSNEKIKHAWARLIQELGLAGSEVDKQAERLSDFYLNDRFTGLNYANFPRVTPLVNSQKYCEPLIASNIQFISTCEHHLVPIEGRATIAYIPKDIIIGLNKLNLILDFFAKRLQLQERLTRQVGIVLQDILQTNDVAVILKAKHNCMSLECIDFTTEHTTFELTGKFNTDLSLRSLLFNSI
mgnify:FL=1